MTGTTLINGALEDIGVLPAGESPATEETATGLTTLNQVVGSLSAQALPIYQILRATIAMTGAGSYNLATRPIKLKAAAVDAAGMLIPFRPVHAEEWADGSKQFVIWQDGGYTTGAVRLRPSPSSGTLEVYTYEALGTWATAGTDVNLPPGYERALRALLAVELAPKFGREASQTMLRNAADALTAISGLNNAIHGHPGGAPPAPPQE